MAPRPGPRRCDQLTARLACSSITCVQESIRDCNRALLLDPCNVGAFVTRGIAKMKHYSKAAKRVRCMFSLLLHLASCITCAIATLCLTPHATIASHSPRCLAHILGASWVARTSLGAGRHLRLRCSAGAGSAKCGGPYTARLCSV